MEFFLFSFVFWAPIFSWKVDTSMSCLIKGCVVHCSKLASMRISKGNHGGKFAPKGPQKMKHQSHWIIRLVLILFKQMVTSGGHFAMLSSLMTVSQKSICCFYLRKIACIFLLYRFHGLLRHFKLSFSSCMSMHAATKCSINRDLVEAWIRLETLVITLDLAFYYEWS